MRSFEEIKNNARISVQIDGADGFKGTIAMPTWVGSIIVTHGAGWNHASVSPTRKNVIPTWDDMSLLKAIVFNDEDAVYQIHPPRSQYVNNLCNCLHLWECYYKPMLLPPSCLVGLRDGQTMEEAIKEIKEAYEMAGEKYDG